VQRRGRERGRLGSHLAIWFRRKPFKRIFRRTVSFLCIGTRGESIVRNRGGIAENGLFIFMDAWLKERRQIICVVSIFTINLAALIRRVNKRQLNHQTISIMRRSGVSITDFVPEVEPLREFWCLHCQKKLEVAAEPLGSGGLCPCGDNSQGCLSELPQGDSADPPEMVAQLRLDAEISRLLDEAALTRLDHPLCQVGIFLTISFAHTASGLYREVEEGAGEAGARC